MLSILGTDFIACWACAEMFKSRISLPIRIRFLKISCYRQWWANIYLHTFDSDLRFLPNRSPTSFTLFFKGRIEGQSLLPSIFCKVEVDASMFFNLDSVKVDSYPSWSTKIDVAGSIFEKKWRPLPFTLIFSFPKNLVSEWKTPTTTCPPRVPIPKC